MLVGISQQEGEERRKENREEEGKEELSGEASGGKHKASPDCLRHENAPNLKCVLLKSDHVRASWINVGHIPIIQAVTLRARLQVPGQDLWG